MKSWYTRVNTKVNTENKDFFKLKCINVVFEFCRKFHIFFYKRIVKNRALFKYWYLNWLFPILLVVDPLKCWCLTWIPIKSWWITSTTMCHPSNLFEFRQLNKTSRVLCIKNILYIRCKIKISRGRWTLISVNKFFKIWFCIYVVRRQIERLVSGFIFHLGQYWKILIAEVGSCEWNQNLDPNPWQLIGNISPTKSTRFLSWLQFKALYL